MEYTMTPRHDGVSIVERADGTAVAHRPGCRCARADYADGGTVQPHTRADSRAEVVAGWGGPVEFGPCLATLPDETPASAGKETVR